MVVSIDFLERLPGHSKEAGGIPNWNAMLHQPGCAGVPQNMRGYIGKSGPIACSGKSALNVLQPAAGVVHDEAQIRSTPPGTTQVAK